MNNRCLTSSPLLFAPLSIAVVDSLTHHPVLMSSPVCDAPRFRDDSSWSGLSFYSGYRLPYMSPSVVLFLVNSLLHTTEYIFIIFRHHPHLSHP